MIILYPNIGHWKGAPAHADQMQQPAGIVPICQRLDAYCRQATTIPEAFARRAVATQHVERVWASRWRVIV